MEISSAISKLQSANITTKALNTQHVHQAKQEKSAANTKGTAATTNKNQEINDKAVISKEALELLKNEYGVENTTTKLSSVQTDIAALVNKNKQSAKTCAYNKAMKSYKAVV